MNQLNQHIEALIFCSEQSISIDEIAASLKLSFDWEPSEEEILGALDEIRLKYASENYPFGLEEISEGYQFLSKKEYHATISALIQHKSRKKLSVAQMETLAIIAYKQPITKSEVEHIRGVNCDYAIHKLLEKEMVSISGKSEGPGRPVLYSTSKNFMDYFGIQNPKDLPQLKDLHMEQNEIGSSSEFLGDENLEEVIADGVEKSETELIEMSNTSAEQELNDNTQVEISVLNEEISGAIPVSSLDEMPPVMGEGEDLILPDRKAIFIESQSDLPELSFEEEEKLRSEDDSTIL
ncbi:MAG: SMC-Scp complex subunit ScpB [Bacteroidia bacterium]|nr:SMC-Scp complex subunit ScpB [Bacteroidia bacterium]